jgi:hypothetical protein
MGNPQKEKLKPPHGQLSWYETFFDLNQRQKIEKVDLDFVRLNIVSSKHEYKVLSGLRFLGLIKEDGTATDKLTSLRLIGGEFTKNLAGIIKEAYSDLFSTIIVEKSKPENLINYFVQRHEMGSSASEQATKLFIYFAGKAEIPLSSELRSTEIEKRPRTVGKPQKRTKLAADAGRATSPPEGVEELKYGDVRIWLPRGDIDAVRKAIRFLEFHIRELESVNS